ETAVGIAAVACRLIAPDPTRFPAASSTTPLGTEIVEACKLLVLPDDQDVVTGPDTVRLGVETVPSTGPADLPAATWLCLWALGTTDSGGGPRLETMGAMLGSFEKAR